VRLNKGLPFDVRMAVIAVSTEAKMMAENLGVVR
jgi:hypothetical protein